nr:serine/threonine protein kinase [Cryptosporangium aurantiacum]
MDAPTPVDGTSAAQAPDGRTVGRRYTLRSSVGSGGMGTVWRAFDELLRREVAVKEVLLPAGIPAPERAVLCERTLREARAAAALNHPAVIRVYDVVNDGDRPWIVMELLDAASLADTLRDEGPLPYDRVAEIGIAVLGALEAAHRVGVLHRDVKPGNVLLGTDGRVTLTDFGVARSPNESPLTSTGLLLGSPQYIAPERARGRPFGPPSDLFSLGATLYTAVEGRPPFDRGDPLPTMTAVVVEPPDQMAFAGPLAPVLLGLLEKDPEQRWDALKTRNALRTVLSGGRITSLDGGGSRAPRQSGPTDRLTGGLRRRREDPSPSPAVPPGTPGGPLSAGPGAPSGTLPGTPSGMPPGMPGTVPGNPSAAQSAKPGAQSAMPGTAGSPRTPSGKPGSPPPPPPSGAAPTKRAVPPAPPGAPPAPPGGAKAPGSSEGTPGQRGALEGTAAMAVNPFTTDGVPSLPAPADQSDAKPTSGGPANKPEPGLAPHSGGPTRAGGRATVRGSVSVPGQQPPGQHQGPGQHQSQHQGLGQHQAGQPGQHQAGTHQAGQPGQHQAGQHQAGQHQPGQHQAGQHQAGQHQAGQHQAGQHQAGQHQQPGQPPQGQHPTTGYARVPGLTPTPPPGGPQGPQGPQGPPPGYGATTYGSPYGGAPNYGEPQNSTAPLPSSPPSSAPRRSAYFGSSGVGGHTMVSPQPPDLSGGHGPQGRRRTVLIVVAIVVVVLLIGLISYLVSVAASGDDSATSARSTSSAAAQSGVELKSYSYPERGFTVKAPADWTAKEASTYIDYDSDDNDKLRVLVENGTSPEQHLKSAESYQKQRLEKGQITAFQTIRQESSTKKIGGEETWEWEFAYTENGVQKHRIWRVAVVDGKAYSVYLTSPAKLFKDRLTLYDEITASFNFDRA